MKATVTKIVQQWSQPKDTWTAQDRLKLEALKEQNRSDLVIDRSVLQKICFIMSVVLTLFGLNNFSTGFTLLGGVDIGLAVAMFGNALLLRRLQPTPAMVIATLSAGGVAVAMAIFSNAYGIYWSYVMVVATFLVVNRRSALLFNVGFILVVVPLTADIMGVAISVRLAITLTLVSVFSYIFSKRIEERTKALLLHLQELDKANSVKSEFIANISHEMRTPLTAVIGYTESLLAANELSETDKEKLDAVVFGSRHLASLIDDVLELNQAEKGHLEVTTEPIDLEASLSKLIKMLEPSAQAKGIDLVLTMPQTLPRRISTDPRRLNQILMNLMANAIKFTEQGSVTLTIDHDASSAELRFSVTDTGIGVPEEFRDELFEKFTQAESGMNRKYGGAGLGLYISQNLASLLQGGIEYIPKDLGSTFQLKIPAAPLEEQSFAESVTSNADPRSSTGSMPQLTGRVLIAEDSPANQMLIGLLLDGFSLTHDKVANGQEAVSALKTQAFDLVLMDLQMPVMSGIEATLAIREFNKDIPIIALSADVLRHDPGSPEMESFTGFLAKPVDVTKMQEMLANLLTSKPN